MADRQGALDEKSEISGFVENLIYKRPPKARDTGCKTPDSYRFPKNTVRRAWTGSKRTPGSIYYGSSSSQQKDGRT